MSETPTLYSHQQHIADFIQDKHRALVFADPGTGKTAAVLEAIRNAATKAIVFCPKSIMWPAWVRDCQTFTPELSIAVAHAPDKERRAAFNSNADIVVINHDGAKWLMENKQLIDDYDFLVLDESTAFKNKDTQRGKAVQKLASHFNYRIAMTGTPMANGLLDLWHQVYLIDDGEHLGGRFYAYRASTHDPIPVKADVNKWVPKDSAVDVVSDMISPITLRYSLEECIDIPANTTQTRYIQLSNKLRKQYQEMERNALLEVEEEEVEAVNAASLVNKLLQIASGAVYGNGDAYKLAPERYDLIAQLITERNAPCLVAFQWKHQRDGLIQALQRHGIDEYAVMDGDNNKNIDDTVTRFQNGEYQCLLAHPQTAGHGLTLTRAKTVIWASPTWNAELFDQFNRRIYRTGQHEKTETILIVAENTVDQTVLSKLTGKIDTQSSALDLLRSMMSTPEAA